MRRFVRVLVAILAAWPALAAAQEWERLDGAAMRAALEDRRLVYARGAWQDFYASGRTLYNAGHDSWGYWRVEGDKSCSRWPPSDLWACYSLEISGESVRFIGASGKSTNAVYAD